MFYVYIYWDTVTETPFYVGKGKGNRANVHINGHSTNLQVKGKIRKMLEEGNKPDVEIVHYDDEQYAYFTERMLIKAMGRIDTGTGTLLNHTNGGEGNSHPGESNPRYGDHRTWEEIYGKEKADELKRNMAMRQMGRKNAMYGVKREDLRQRNLTNNPNKGN